MLCKKASRKAVGPVQNLALKALIEKQSTKYRCVCCVDFLSILQLTGECERNIIIYLWSLLLRENIV